MWESNLGPSACKFDTIPLSHFYLNVEQYIEHLYILYTQKNIHDFHGLIIFLKGLTPRDKKLMKLL